MSRICEDCGLPLNRCICDEQACYRCGVEGCQGECVDDELELGDDVDELNFNHEDES